MKLFSIFCLTLGLSLVSGQGRPGDETASTLALSLAQATDIAAVHALDVRGTSHKKVSASTKKRPKTKTPKKKKTSKTKTSKKKKPSKKSKKKPSKTSKKKPSKTSKKKPSKTTQSHETSQASLHQAKIPRKCTESSCGKGSCSLQHKRSDLDIRSDNGTLAERAFVEPAEVGAVRKLKSNVDISDSRDWFSDWKMYRKRDKSATIEGLEGCSVVVLYSEKGFQSFHLFESPAFNGDGVNSNSQTKPGWIKVPPGGTLYSGNDKKFLNEKLEDLSAAIEATKSEMGKNPKLALLMPQQGTGWRYDQNLIHPWAPVTAKGASKQQKANGRMVLEQAVAPPSDVSATIISAVEKASGLTAETFGYKVDEEKGTNWVFQYSPNQNGKQQVQMWVDDKELLTGQHEYTWT